MLPCASCSKNCLWSYLSPCRGSLFPTVSLEAPRTFSSSGSSCSGFMGDVDCIQMLVQSSQSSNGNNDPSFRGRKGQIILHWELKHWKWGRLMKKFQTCLHFGRNRSYQKKKSSRSIHISESRWYSRISHFSLFLLTQVEMVKMVK